MDKFEKKVRVGQILSLIDKGIYDEALEIADTIDWRNEKSIKTLRVVSELYKVNRRYEDAFNVLTIAYERDPDDPIKRKIVYDLSEIAIKINQYAYAVKFMKEYEKLSPNDPGKYVLRYKLLKVTGADYSERIELLEEFKKEFFGDFREKWAYELAQLYRSTGQTRQCINACDEIILWFIKGPYVTRAKELKASLMSEEEQPPFDNGQGYVGNGDYYEEQSPYGNAEQPIGNPQYQDPYSGQGYGQPETDPGYGGYGAYGQPSMQPNGMQIEVRNVYASNEPTIRMPDRQLNGMNYDLAPDEISINLDRDGTINLTEELKANMADYSRQTGDPLLQKEERIPEPDVGMTELFDTRNMQQDQGMYGSQQYPDQRYGSQQYDPQYGGQAYEDPQYGGQLYGDGQYGEQPYDPGYDDRQYDQGMDQGVHYDEQRDPGQTDRLPREDDRQGTGRPVIPEEPREPGEYERKFPEDEKAEPVVEELERADFVKNVPVYRQSPSNETLYRAGEVAKPRVIKKTDFGESLPRMPQQYRNILSEGYDGQLNMNVPDEPAQLERQITGQLDLDTVLLQWKEDNNRKKFATITPSQVKREEVLKQERVQPSRIPKKDKAAVPVASESEVVPVENASEESLVQTLHPERVPAQETTEQQIPEQQIPEQQIPEQQAAGQQITEQQIPEQQMVRQAPPSGQGRPRQPVMQQTEELPVVKNDFTEDEREIYSPFISIGGMAGRLLAILPLVSMTGRKGNIIISGNEPTLRMALAQSFAKDVQLKNTMMGIKVAKISADTFNTKDIEKSLRAMDGNILVIERAGRLSPQTVAKMLEILSTDGLSLLVIMEDSKNALRNLPLNDGLFRSVFSVEADIPRFTNDDLVRHAQDYAREREYQIDDLAILALYRRIDELQTADHLVTAEEVEDIMDGAIKNVNKKNMTHFMDVLFAKRYNKDDLIIIREKDFEKR